MLPSDWLDSFPVTAGQDLFQFFPPILSLHSIPLPFFRSVALKAQQQQTHTPEKLEICRGDRCEAIQTAHPPPLPQNQRRVCCLFSAMQVVVFYFVPCDLTSVVTVSMSNGKTPKKWINRAAKPLRLQTHLNTHAHTPISSSHGTVYKLVLHDWGGGGVRGQCSGSGEVTMKAMWMVFSSV